MTETEKMEKYIPSIRRLGEVLHKSIGSDYHAISLRLAGGFSGWMHHQEKLAGIPDGVAWACHREYNRYLLREVRAEAAITPTMRKTILPFIAP